MKNTPRTLVAALVAGLLTLPAMGHTQKELGEDHAHEPAIQNAPANSDEPSIDELLGLEDEGDKPEGPDKPAADPAAPELTRDLDKRLSGDEASQQFVQAIQEMGEVAIMLGEEADPGIQTQRKQKEIIDKLQQIIDSAQKVESQQQQQQQGGEGSKNQPRKADKGGLPQPGSQPGAKPGQKPGDKPGEGQKPGDKAGDGKDGKKPGQGQGEKPGEGKSQGGKQPGNGSPRNGTAQDGDQSMSELAKGNWGNLPPRLREELSESLKESFNPVYRSATEAFYRRIAEMSRERAEEGAE